MKPRDVSTECHAGAQVPASHYSSLKYMSLMRVITHWHQAAAIVRVLPPGRSVLEIGPGSGHTTWLLRSFGYNVTTLDVAQDLKPDIVGSVINLGIADRSFDIVLAAEVLEHIPYESFELALRELNRVASHTVIVTLPAPLIGVSAIVNVPRLMPISLSFGIPYKVSHRFDGEHYWELGKKDYSLRRIRKSMQGAGFEIKNSYRPAPSLFTYLFVLAVNLAGNRDSRL